MPLPVPPLEPPLALHPRPQLLVLLVLLAHLALLLLPLLLLVVLLLLLRVLRPRRAPPRRRRQRPPPPPPDQRRRMPWRPCCAWECSLCRSDRPAAAGATDGDTCGGARGSNQ